MKKFLVLLGLLTLMSCAEMDNQAKREASHFYPKDGTFTFIYEDGPGSQKGEEKRWLNEYLKDNKMCPSGYVFLDHKRVITGKNFLGVFSEHTYKGKCK